MTDAELGHRTCTIGQIGHIAIQRGHRLEWNPETERFTNADEANKLLAESNGLRTHAPWRGEFPRHDGWSRR